MVSNNYSNLNKKTSYRRKLLKNYFNDVNIAWWFFTI